MRVKIAVFASGDGSNFEAIFQAAKGYEVAILIVDKEAAFAQERAKRLGVHCAYVNPQVFSGKAHYEKEILRLLAPYDIALIVLAGYMRKVGKTLLQAYPQRILNIHPSLLPSYKGLDALKRSFNAKDAYVGMTIHVVDAHLDHGKILKQAKRKRTPSMSFEACKAGVSRLEHTWYPKVIENYIKEVK